MAENDDDLDDLLNKPLNEAECDHKKIKLLELVKNGTIEKYCGRNFTEEKIIKCRQDKKLKNIKFI